MRPLILLSPAKTLNFEAALSPSLAKAAATAPQYLSEAHALASSLGTLSKPELAKLMSLSAGLASLNHGRFADFTSQPTRIAAAAFEGPAYKGLDAASLDNAQLGYLQGSLRILCGLYGVLRPLDEIRPYRLEMSTRYAHGGHATLYGKWRDVLTASLNAELDTIPAGPAKFVLNVASQEYAKAVVLDQLRAPVVTAAFPGPSVHAKTARGQIARFCAVNCVSSAAQLREFRGSSGE